MKKQSFNFSVTKQLASVNEVLTADIARMGELLMIQVFSATVQTTQPARFDFGYIRGAQFVPYLSVVNPAVNQTFLFSGNIFLVRHEIPALRVTGGVIGDNIQMAIGGYTLSVNDREE